MTTRRPWALLTLCLIASPAAGQWPADPMVNVALCNAEGSQADNGLIAVPSINGGTIAAWQDNRDSDYDIYAQRLSSIGETQWPDDGVPVCTAAGMQLALQGVSDGAGGAILVWVDLRDGEADIYAQRIDPDGNLMWPVGSPSVDGVPVCATAEHQTWINVVSDGSGGAIVTWEHGVSPGDIHAQRLDSNGELQWGSDSGVVVSDAAGVQQWSRIVSDGAGGAILVWTDGRNNPSTSYDIYAQRIDATGGTQWAGDLPVCTLTQAQTYPAIAADGFGGAFMAWFDNEEIWAQHVNSSGVPQWAANGILINDSALDSQHTLRGVGSGVGSAIFVWQDLRNYPTTGRDLYAQSLSTGGPAWTAGGVVISQASGDQRDPAIASPRGGSVVIAWVDGRSGVTTPDIYALEILDGSSFNGPPDGLAVCTAEYGQWKPVVGTSGLGDAVLVWADSRNIATGADIYAQGVFLAVVFADGFESGDASAWSSSTP
jgi:hypothetical protein